MMVSCKLLLARRRQWYAVGSKLLQYWENVPFSHCAIEVDGFVYESVFPEGRMLPKADWLKKYHVTHEFSKDVSDETADQMEVWFIDQVVGRHYSVWHLVVIGMTLTSKAIENLVIGSEFDGSRTMICTESCGRFMSRFFDKVWTEKHDWLSLKDIENGAMEVFK